MRMTDLLADLYPWTKALHIVSMVTWMAGLFYMPRLFVYHVEHGETTPEIGPVFEIMEVKLLRLIMNPAFVATWVFGLALVFTPGIVDWSSVWPWTKAAAVLVLSWYHHWLGWRRKDFLIGRNTTSGRTFRIMNEVPTLCLLVIVFSVVLKF
jgi:putative membrane protein